MTTTVIHIRDSGGPNETYIGRPGQKNPAAIFGNPYSKGRECVRCGEIHNSGGSTLPCYELYLRSRLGHDKEFASKFWALRGNTLVCFCRPKGGFEEGAVICHGQVMAHYLDCDTGTDIEKIVPLLWALDPEPPGSTNENPSGQGES